MKVSTEACIFGASVEVDFASKILDIGAGTGLLSLMMAQRTNAQITAVEINDQAAEQCKENFEKSPWADRLSIVHSSIQDFSQSCQTKFDVIISNPPFYNNHLKPRDNSRAVAMHNDLLTSKEIAQAIYILIKNDGVFYLLSPSESLPYFRKAFSARGLHANTLTTILNRKGGPVFREITRVSLNRQENNLPSNIVIRNDNDNYTTEFRTLLSPYYLNL